MANGLPKGYYTNKMSKLNMSKTGKGYKLTLYFTPQGKALDRAQDALDAQVWNDVQKYMPMDTGILKTQTNSINAYTRGRVYMYPPNSDYGHYLYEGRTMVDPNTGSTYAGKGVQKVYVADYVGEKATNASEYLTYSQQDAQAHWGEVAYRNHHDEWVKVVQRALQ